MEYGIHVKNYFTFRNIILHVEILFYSQCTQLMYRSEACL